MNTRTELHSVLKMRDEAAEIIRRHGEATSRVGAAYAATVGQIESFRESLGQAVKGVTSLTGAVRDADAELAEGSMPRPWIMSGSDIARDVEAAREAVREQIVSYVDEGRPDRVRRDGASDRADGSGRQDRDLGALGRRILDDRAATDAARILSELVARATPTSPRWQAPAADFAEVDTLGGRCALPIASVEHEASRAALSDRAAAAATLLPGSHSMDVLRAMIDSASRILADVRGNALEPPLSRHDPGSLDEVVERRRSVPTLGRLVERGIVAAGESGAVTVPRLSNAESSADLEAAPRTRRPLPQVSSGDSSPVALAVSERRAMVVDMRDSLAFLLEEIRKAIAPSKDTPTIERERKSDETVLELLRGELRRLAPSKREIEEVAIDRGARRQEEHDTALGTRIRRSPDAPSSRELGPDIPESRSLGVSLQDVAADWRAYGNGIAGALASTDQVLTGILMQTRDWRSAMHGLITSVVADFARIAIRQNVTGPLADAVLGDRSSGGDAGLLGRAFGWITSLFAGGGIMTARGPVPLRAYASGGIATGPQLALFGEGSTPEAYVPVPNGRIPVTLRGGMGGGSIATNIVINVAGAASSSDAGVGADPAEQARNIGALVTAAFNRNLAEQMRPGGLLNPAGTLGSGLVH